jgi:hypothetical protein
MGLNALQWAFLGWAASAYAADSGSRAGQGGEDQVHLEMRAAGAQFGQKVAAITLASLRSDVVPPDAAKHARAKVCDDIRDRAAWWADNLRHTGINPRLAERLVTVWVAAAHEASRQRLRAVRP